MDWMKFVKIAVVLVVAGFLGACAQKDPYDQAASEVGPKTKKARELVGLMKDHRQAADVKETGFGSELNCGSVAGLSHDFHTGNARVWTARKHDRTLQCYDYPGFNGVGQELHEIKKLEIDEILADPARYPPPAPLPIPAPTPAATPVPQVSATVLIPEIGATPIPVMPSEGYCDEKTECP